MPPRQFYVAYVAQIAQSIAFRKDGKDFASALVVSHAHATDPATENSLTTKRLEDVRAYLDANQDALLTRWRELARAQTSLPEQRLNFSDDKLDNHLRALLHVLVGALGNGIVPDKTIEQHGAQHGHDRRVLGYEIAQVAWEFTLFRQLVRQTIEELAPAQPAGVLYTARELLMRLIDMSEFGSIEQYVQETTEERDTAQEQLRVASEQRSSFLALLSHELRNPLAATRTALHILRKDGVTNIHRERALDVIDRQAKYQTRLINDLLDVDRISQGKIRLKRETLDLRKSIDNAVEADISAIEAKGIRFRFVCPDHQVPAFADAVRVEQIVSYLLGNALKFTQAGGSIEISLQGDEGDAVIRVRDTGAGWDRSMLDRVFELFAPADTNMCDGLGVGLWLARQLTEMHGGTIQASSEGPDSGTEVTVRLPCVSEEHEEHSQKASSAIRVLLVEDNADQREMMVLALSDVETHIVGAKDAAEALALMSEKRFDVYILDLNLPDISGYELAVKILQLHRGSRPLLIALTGDGRPENAAQVMEAGFDRHLVKPAEIESLQRLIHSREKA